MNPQLTCTPLSLVSLVDEKKMYFAYLELAQSLAMNNFKSLFLKRL